MSGDAVAQRDIVVVGASAGGIEALEKVVGGLPPELPASVLVVLHVLPTGTSALPQILDRAGPLPASAARSGEKLERGRIYVASPDRHMLVKPGRVALSRGPRENGVRPAVDPLFRSAARVYGERVIGVVLSGSLDDGAEGLRFVKARGGAAVVQDPDDAAVASMPESALALTDADRVVPADAVGPAICELIDESLGMRSELSVVDLEPDRVEKPPHGPPGPHGELSGLTCPDCGGALWQHEEGGHLHFACHVGHAYSPRSLVHAQGDDLEAALWSALRSLEERADLFRRMAHRRTRGQAEATAARFETQARIVEKHAAVVRGAIMELGTADPSDEEPTEAPEAAAE